MTPKSKNRMSLVVKRGFDLVVVLILLILFAPLFLIIAAAIKLTSRGPVFFVQARLGKGRRVFPLFKFRTMVIDWEGRLALLESMNEITGPVFKIKNDPRITTVGRFLRKTSIDELPQLFNVLRGDMSIVGPRSLPAREYLPFREDWLEKRFSVRPGMICLWQISGRNSLTFERWMEMDMLYIESWTLWLDVKILIKTIPSILFGSGAA